MALTLETLSPASAEEIADAIAFALRYSGRKRVHDAAEMMSLIVAKRLVAHLDLERLRPQVALLRLAGDHGPSGEGIEPGWGVAIHRVADGTSPSHGAHGRRPTADCFAGPS